VFFVSIFNDAAVLLAEVEAEAAAASLRRKKRLSMPANAA
jgi:hypothetical protein